jgi:hypothetical protein
VNGRTRIVTAAVIVVLLVLGAVVTNVETETPAVEASGPRVDAVGASTTWYCAEGTANPGGRASEELVVGNVDRRPTQVVVTVDAGVDVAPVLRPYTVAPGRVLRIRVSDLAPVADPGIVVETTGGRAVVEHLLDRFGDTALGPCAREPVTSARFAAGTTSKGSELWLALFNPFPDDAIVDVEAVTEGGRRAPGQLQGIVVPRQTRVSVPIHDSIPRVDTVATQVTVRRGRIVAEQSQFLDGSDGRRGLALSLGSDLARTWRFPIGISGSGRQQRLVLANPGGRDTTVRVAFTLDAAAAVEPQELILPATSVLTPDLSLVPPDIGFSITVRSSLPIVAESIGASSTPQPAEARGIATDPGLTAGARVWAVVPARLSVGSTDVLGVMSADGRRHRVRVFRVDATGDTEVLVVGVPGTGRTVIDLARLTRRSGRAFLLRADGPVLVERESTRPGFTRSHAVPG